MFWQRISAGDCHPHAFEAALFAHSACNVITDLILATLPAFILHQSKLSRKRKIMTAGVLGIGAWSVDALFRDDHSYTD